MLHWIPGKLIIRFECHETLRIRVLPIKENGGIIGALNHGLDSAKGQFIARMDSDDVAVEDRFECARKSLSSRLIVFQPSN